ncbi:hypothetical protein V8F20_012066 [Naviculisporaceae sp. PSN 640]
MGDSIPNTKTMSPNGGSQSGPVLTPEYLNSEIKYNRERINMIEGKIAELETPMLTRRTFSAPDPARTEITDDTDITMGDYMCLTAAKTIPKVRECTFVEFKNRFDPKGRDGRFAVDVLVSGPLLHQEIQEEHRLRDKLFLKKPPKLATRIVDDKSLKKAVKMANVNVDLIAQVQTDGMKWPRRIRLQSPALIRMLARCNRERWTDRQRTYYRPFNALIYHHPKMCEILAGLEERWGAQVDAEEAQNPSNDDDNESQDSGDRPDDEDSDDVVNSPEALKCLRAYVKYIDENILPDYHKYEKMDVGSPNANVRFSDLWYLFRTGELVYRQVDGELPDRRDFRTGKRIWKTFYVDPIPEREMAAFTDDDEIRDTATKNDERTFRLGCYYIDYNGEEFCCVKTEVKIEQFSGEMPINSLPIYPMRFCQDWKGRLAHAIKTGEELINFIQVKHCSYNGWTLTRDPTGEPTTDAKGNTLEQPEHINSEVMVDFAEAFQQCPQWRPLRASMREKIVDGLTLPEEFKIRWWSGDDRAILLGETTEQIPVRSGVTWKQRNAFVSQDPFLSRVAENVKNGRHTTVEHLNLGWDTKALLTGRVFAYVFQERKFAQLAVAKLRPSPKTGLPLHSLRIPDQTKHAIQGSIEGHFRQKSAERQLDQDWVSLDLIEGKGSGLFILLHGVPGVGKTATAEAIAKANGKPLFKITVGDLGMTPENLETSLREIFRLASIWDCILLLDEVDTFFSARSKGDTATAKNGLVSEFLRVLDYYDGILFLTTNRAGVLDEAFKSRIHFKIYYPNLTLEQTIDIWKLNIERTRQIEEQLSRAEGRLPLEIEENTLLAFAEFHYKEAVKQGKGGHWNGRQIRNAFQVARSLAYYEHGIEEEKRLAEATAGGRDGGVMLSAHRPPKLKVSHFTTMHELTDSFEKYLSATRGGYSDSETALENEYRHDRFKDQLTEGLQNAYREGFYRNLARGQVGAEETVTEVLVHQHQHRYQNQNSEMGSQPQAQGQRHNDQQRGEFQQYAQQRQDQNLPSNIPSFPQQGQQNFQVVNRARSNTHRLNTAGTQPASSPPPDITLDSISNQGNLAAQPQQSAPQMGLFPGQPQPRHTASRESLLSDQGITSNSSADQNVSQGSTARVGIPNVGRPRSGTGASNISVGLFPGQSQSHGQSQNNGPYSGTPPTSNPATGNCNANSSNPNTNMNFGAQGPVVTHLGTSPTPRGPSPAINIPLQTRNQGQGHRDSFGSGGSGGGAGSYGRQLGQDPGPGSQGGYNANYTYGSNPGPQFSGVSGSQGQFNNGTGPGIGGAGFLSPAGGWNYGQQQPGPGIGRYSPAGFNTGTNNPNLMQYQVGQSQPQVADMSFFLFLLLSVRGGPGGRGPGLRRGSLLLLYGSTAHLNERFISGLNGVEPLKICMRFKDCSNPVGELKTA